MITQKPKVALTVNVSPETCKLLDEARCRHGLTRHGLLLRCLSIALPILADEAEQSSIQQQSAK